MAFHIYNNLEEKVAVLSLDQVGEHTPVISANLEEKLDTYEVLYFTVPADAPEAKHLVEANTIIYKDIKGWREYSITEVVDTDGDLLTKMVSAELSSAELMDEVIEIELKGTLSNPKTVLTEILKGTRWSAGYVDEGLYNKKFNVETKYLTVMEGLNELASDYSAEVQYSYEIDQGQIVARKVNLYKTFGKNEGKRFEIEKDITSIERTVDVSSLKTSIIPYTPEKEIGENDGEKEKVVLDIKSVVWSKANGDPTDKPFGQNWIGDSNALKNFGRKGAGGKLRHRTKAMEIDVDSPEALISMAWMQLGRYSVPKITYEVKAIDLYKLTGSEDFKHENVMLGDTVVAIDKNFAVPIMIQTRVVEVNRNLLDGMENEFVFGASKGLFTTNDNSEMDKIKDRIGQIVEDMGSIQESANGFTTVYRGSEQPAGPREGDIWFRPHPSVPGAKQTLSYNGVAWEVEMDTSITDTISKEVGVIKERTNSAIQKAQDAVDKAESVEGALVFKVDSKDYTAKMNAIENNINMRVEKGDIIHQINISDEEILIAGDKIIISGDTTVDGSFKITNEMVASGISADKITVGTLNGKTVNIMDLNADNITGGNLNIQNIKLMNGNQEVVSVSQDGQVNMNVSSLRIGQFNATTTEDLEKLESQYTFILSNDSATIPTDKDGNNGDYTTATTQPIIYRLGVLDTSNWNITVSASTGITGALLNGEYKITKMTTDTGKVSFTAKKDNLTLTKVFNITKAKAGKTGATGATGPQGATGASGKDGVAGKDGKGIKSTAIAYATSTSGTTKPATDKWGPTVPSLTKGQYLWTRTIWTYTDNTTETGYSVSYIAKDGNTGKDGLAGKDGVGISSTAITYVSSTSGTTKPTSGWTTAIPTVSAGNYLWTKTVWTYTDNTNETGYSVGKIGNTGAKGATGATGPQGPQGASGKDGVAGKDGKGITSTTITYGLSTTDTVEPTKYTSNVPTLVKGQYLWTKTVWKYTDTTTETGYTKTYIAKDGNTGKDGLPGKAGVGISNTKIEYAGSTSGTTKPTSGWNAAVPTVASGSFLWTRTIWTYTDNTTETGYSVARMGVNGATGGKGDTGATGASATSYWITASNNIIGKSQTGVINPTTITFKGFSKTGTANPVAYSGRFIIQTSTNGTTYDKKYTSGTNQNTCTYTIPANTLFVKCLFYMAGGTTVLLDEQTVPIVESAEGIEVGGEQLLKNQSKDWTQKDLTTNNHYFQEGSDYKVEVGQTYTFSIVVEKVSTDTVPINLSLGLGSSVGMYTWDFPKGTRYGMPMGTKVSITFTVLPTDGTSGTHTYFAWRLRNEKKATSIKYKEVKLEKGNIPTDWTPAPEDARTYKAWANSSDGTVDFTRTLPNENLFLESFSSYELGTYAYMDINPGLVGLVGKVYEKDSTVDMTGVYFGFTELGVDGTIGVNWLMVSGTLYANASTTGVKSKRRYFSFYPNNEETFDKIKARYSVKLEKGTEATAFTTSTEDSLSGSVMQYIGLSPLNSDNPSEYEWIVNPEYTKALSDETTNEALEDINGSLEDKIGREEYSELEKIADEFSKSYEAFVSDGGKHEEDLKKLEDRMELLILELKEKVVKLDFVETYMVAGDEGLLIGSKDSQTKMLLKNNRLSFTDGGKEVAFFSGQSFTINSGAIVDDLQIGEHKLTSLSNGHTVIQWIKK